MTTETSLAARPRQRNPLVFLALVVLALIGVGFTDYSPADAHLYWVFMVLVCAVTSIVSEFMHSRGYSEHTSRVMVQVVHWSACFVAVLITYSLVHTGRLNNADAGLVLLLLLSLSVFLDGVHLGVYAYLFGTLLAFMTVAMAYVEEFIWMILLASVAVSVLAALFRAKSRPG